MHNLNFAYILGSLKEQNWFNFVMDPDVAYIFEHYPLESQLEFANLILLFYNLHIISNHDFIQKYILFIEEQDFYLQNLQKLAKRKGL